MDMVGWGGPLFVGGGWWGGGGVLGRTLARVRGGTTHYYGSEKEIVNFFHKNTLHSYTTQCSTSLPLTSLL